VRRWTGVSWTELDPGGWYDTRRFDAFMKKYTEGSITREGAIVTLGRRVPDRVQTPLQAVEYEAEGFLENHRGSDVVPRRFLRLRNGDVLVEAVAPGYDSRLYVGVFKGILEMREVPDGQVVQTRSQERGDPVSEFRITW